MSRFLSRRRLLLLVTAAVAVAAPTAALVLSGGAGGDPTRTTGSGDDTGTSSSHRTVEVAARDLSTTVTASGTVGYGEARTVNGTGRGVITSLPAPGTIIGVDQALYGVDGGDGPVLLGGDLPQWRALDRWTDDGDDITQLEANLAALGLADADLTVDTEFTALTADAVEAWQDAHGWDDTGRVALGDIWFSPGPVRVATVEAEVGAPDEGEVLTVTGTDRRVIVEVDSVYGTYLTEGGAVILTLPDGSTVTGTATDVADVVTVVPAEQPGEADTSTITVIVTPDEELAVLDDTPIQVEFQVDTLTGVPAVPVDAVVVTADGRYALEVVDADGSTRLVEVTLGRFADGWVQVSGDIEVGTEVVTA